MAVCDMLIDQHHSY